MKLCDIKEILNAVALTNNSDMSINIERAYGADLMSDVLAFSMHGSILITGLTNVQVIRTAEVADLKAVIFVQGKRPDPETIAMAEKKNIPLLATSYSMFGTCGRLFEKGIEGRSNRDK